jgi:hypothetical protein
MFDSCVFCAILVVSHAPPTPIRELTSAVEEHWLSLMQAAVASAARGGRLPYFGKAFVWLEAVTPRGSDNTRLWDTSNRAVNLVINNLKGVFFRDDNHEHMAFGVAGRWGEKGATVVHIFPFDRLGQIMTGENIPFP